MDIREKVRDLPALPGVYIMRDAAGAVLYVGKAGSLKKRVSSYFYPSKILPTRLRVMVEKIRNITYLVTASEAEALIYENNLIKQLAPRYNVALRDGKSYPLLKLTIAEKFPRLFVTRDRKEDGNLYCGPYASPRLLREALDVLHQTFPLRRCGKMEKKPCLHYHLRQCLAPCAGKIGEEAYRSLVAEVRLFLAGRRLELIDLLTKKMVGAARAEHFEEAAALRAKIEALASIKEESVHYGPANEIEELGRLIGMAARPETIEAFDISNIGGTEAVGSMVVFVKGKPAKGRYRRFRIRTVGGIDDYAMMREVIRRRYRRLHEEGGALPDLILIDGGKGHLAAAVGELRLAGITGVPAIGLAKEFEHIHLQDRADPLVLPKEAKALHLLQRIRDEAHRFAIAYHRALKAKSVVRSGLDAVPGIGPKRKAALMRHFGSLDRIRAATIDDLRRVEGLDARSARAIIAHLKG